jgi:uncharacterized YccA/Bax inhibitor family protein
MATRTNPMLEEAPRALRSPGVQQISEDLSVADILVRTVALLAMVVVGAGIGWVFIPYNLLTIILLSVAAIGLAVTAARKMTTSPGLPVAFSLVEGLLVGSFSGYLANLYGGEIVYTAVAATAAVFVTCLAVFFIPAVRNSGQGRKIFTVMILGYIVLSLASFGLAVFTGLGGGWGFFGLGTFGILLSIGAVALSAWSLVINFGSVDEALKQGAPRDFAWILSMGLVVSIVWVYLEILRLLALLQRN